VTTPTERSGALEAIERIVNRGEADVVAETLAVLERLYPSVELRAGTLTVERPAAEDEPFLRRVTILISAHVSSAENA
jgi:hypothetical protein